MRSLISTKWFRGFPRPVTLFAGITLVFLAALAWLSWRVIAQDRAVERQRWLERCEVAAENASAQLTRQLAELQSALANATAGRAVQIPAQGIALLIFRGESLEATPGTKLPYYPALRAAPESAPDRFIAAEALEFREKQPLKAAALYAQLREHRDPEVRAAALVRLARVYRKAKLTAKALEAYAALAGMGSVMVEGDPAEMLARLGSAEVYMERSDAVALKREASAITAALAEGRWVLRRSSYEYLEEQCREWLGGALSAEPPLESLALADVAETLYVQWKNGALNIDSPNPRKSLWARDRSVLAFWNSEDGQLSLLCAGPSYLKTILGQAPGAEANLPEIVLEDPEGHRVLGSADNASALRVVRMASLTGLPWTIYAVPSNPRALADRLSAQAKVLLIALALMIFFALAAAVFVARSISRELAVARLQSDFVAAVSHEFRSPLTTIMQLSEMLVRGRVSSDERRTQFYDTLLGESRRLHGLVESILNFGRVESGKYHYDFRAADLGELAHEVVEDFSKSAAEQGHSVEFRRDGGPLPVRADREALGRALRNLLDNAVKYSPEHPIIRVEVAGDKNFATLSVRDRGLGIPPHEQKAIFTKFVRGAAAKERSIKGTGIGLAMAQAILEAHGGTIEVESVPAEGSVFRMRLPRAEA